MRKNTNMVLADPQAVTAVSIIDRHRKPYGNPGQVIQAKLARCRRIKFWNIGLDLVRTISRVLARHRLPFEVVDKISLVIYVETNATLNALRGKPHRQPATPDPLPLRPFQGINGPRKSKPKAPIVKPDTALTLTKNLRDRMQQLRNDCVEEGIIFYARPDYLIRDLNEIVLLLERENGAT